MNGQGRIETTYKKRGVNFIIEELLTGMENLSCKLNGGTELTGARWREWP